MADRRESNEKGIALEPPSILLEALPWKERMIKY
jgi:hypothetical protein